MSEELRSAGLLLRTAAKVLDFILIAAVIEIIPRAGFFAGLAYLLLSDGLFDGRSIGKKLIKLKVVSSDTQQSCTFRGSILRNSTFGLGYLLWLIPWIGWVFIIIISLLELILALGSSEGKRLGDEFAGTSVIEET
jgi:uncharacterized RDD family membrane protein YckC